MKSIYLDYSATTPLDPRVLEVMIPVFSGMFGNASSVHSFGREARAILEKSRETIARFIGSKSNEVFFTSGGTEADNHAIKGLAEAGLRKGKKQIITSAVEHHAVLHPVRNLRKSGFDVIELPVDEYGRVDPQDVQKSITPSTALISLMLANNEIGTLNDVHGIGAIARQAGVPFHSDAVQAVGKIDVNVEELNVDVLSISAHKFYGPKGVGAIYIRKGVQIDSFVEGGAQESNRRAGTESVPLAVGFAKAAEIARESMDASLVQIRGLRSHLLDRLKNEFTGLLFNGHPTDSLPHILSVSFDSSLVSIDGDALIMGMDLRGVAVTSGSACTSGSLQASHVLLAIGRDENTARATIRFSLGRNTTRDELDSAMTALSEVVEKAKKHSPSQ
ncbi:MAG: cysteine desulfurase family protein [Ignavibacteriales bacterium]|nr:cysteine desulfurase family protein [Ignavibacteriales bacterium]